MSSVAERLPRESLRSIGARADFHEPISDDPGSPLPAEYGFDELKGRSRARPLGRRAVSRGAARLRVIPVVACA